MYLNREFIVGQFLTLLYGPFCSHAHATGGDHQLTVLISVFSDGLSEDQFAGAPPLSFPGLPWPRRRRQNITGLGRTVIFVVLFGMQASPAAPTAWLYPAGFFA